MALICQTENVIISSGYYSTVHRTANKVYSCALTKGLHVPFHEKFRETNEMFILG